MTFSWEKSLKSKEDQTVQKRHRKEARFMKMECNPPLWQSRRRAPSFVFYLRYAHRKISFLSANRAGLMFLAKNSQPHYFLNSCRH